MAKYGKFTVGLLYVFREIVPSRFFAVYVVSRQVADPRQIRWIQIVEHSTFDG